MEVYSYNEKIQNQKIFDSKNLKETYSDFKNGENILSKINEKSSTPQNQHYFTQKDYEETKVIKENDPQTKETYISLKSKIVFGDNKETAKTKDSKDKKTEKNINEMKILPSLNESAHKPSDDDIINADLKKLSEKKNKTESKIKVPPIDKPKKIETKNETEVMRNPNQELPKKEKIFSENLSPKQNKLLDEPFESVQNIEKPQINSKKVMRVNLNEESIKVLF